MSKTIQEIAQIAAEWWADKVCSPNMGNFDNGDKSNAGAMCMMLATLLTKPEAPSTRIVFIQKMVDKIVAKAQTHDEIEKEKKDDEKHYDWSIGFGCDYGPDYFFNDIIAESGVNPMNFPWKTQMWISKNKVSVSAGYGARPVYLYANKNEYRKLIKDAEENIESYRNGELLRYMADGIDKEERVKERIAELKMDIEKYKVELEKAEE